MNKMPVISAKDFYSYLIKYGCVHVSNESSHFKVQYPPTGKCMSVPIHGNKDISRGFMKTILTKLGIDVDDFIGSIR